jgi:hypothetical protein
MNSLITGGSVRLAAALNRVVGIMRRVPGRSEENRGVSSGNLTVVRDASRPTTNRPSHRGRKIDREQDVRTTFDSLAKLSGQ